MLVVRYTCHACGVAERQVIVKARDPETVVTAWVESVAWEAGRDHAATSPDCPERKIDILIPVQDADYIGQDPDDSPKGERTKS